MNLVELDVENYRQFQGPHVFTPGEQGMVAVIGLNGAGKTTLFEAIEWCLYNPRQISNDDIQNRVYPGRPRVKVTLEHPHTGEQFEVERELRGRTVAASVYRSSQPDSPVVQGTRQVTDYVTKQLLGLGHDAFVATFFTRQKELSFFGDYRTADRRREVGRLLGLETIRLAQQSIGQKRLDKQNEAKAKKHHYDEQSSSIDFTAERHRHQQSIEGRSHELAAAESALASATAEHDTARETLTREQNRSHELADLSLQESRLEGVLKECAAQIAAANGSLQEIDRAEQELTRLAPIAAKEPVLLQLVQSHELEKRKSAEIEELNRRSIHLDQSEAQLKTSVVDAERAIAPESYDRLAILEETPAQLEHEIQRLLARARSADVQTAQHLVNCLVDSRQRFEAVNDDSSKHRKWSDAATQLEQRLEELLARGDPQPEISEAEQEKSQFLELASAARATAKSLQSTRDPLAALRGRLSQGQFDEECPTCGRPFEEGERESYIASLSIQISSLDHQLATHATAQAQAENDARLAAEREQAARSDAAALHTLQTRIASSKPHIEEAEANLRRSQEALDSLLKSLNRHEAPTDDEVAGAQERLRDAQRIAAQIPRLEQLIANLNEIQLSRMNLLEQLQKLGPSQYNGESHRTDSADWEQSKHAAAQIVVLQQRVEGRPAALSTIESAGLRTQETQTQVHALRQRITALDYRQSALESARATESAFQERFNRVLAKKHQAESRLSGIKKELESLIAWETRLEQIRDESVEAQREADELDRMYKEFTRFEQHVALSVTPALADLTSQLVSAVTDGKYDRIEFTEDFGIDVFDGAEDRFPLSQFSGGERDVIALCARLALSQFIGGQAQTPLQFVVMDEVFGSLDRERRQNLVETLQKLVEASGSFKQLFVISHVDDVRASPAFDEIWRVEESSDGISRLERVTSTTSAEDD